MKTLVALFFLMECSSMLFAEECQYVQGFPMIIETKTCRSEGTKFCRAKIKCGTKVKDIICPSDGLYSCPSVSECQANNKYAPTEGKVSDDEVDSREERTASGAPSKASGGQAASGSGSSGSSGNSVSAGGSQVNSGGGGTTGGSINKEHTADEIVNRTFKEKVDLIALLSGKEKKKADAITSFIEQKKLENGLFYLEIELSGKEKINLLIQKILKKNNNVCFNLPKDRYNLDKLSKMVEVLEHLSIGSKKYDILYDLILFITHKMEEVGSAC